MEGFRLVDIFSTKGIDYLWAGGFFVAFYAIFRYMNAPQGEAHRETVLSSVVEWFRVPQDLFFHRGHSWARLAGANAATLGMDDYAAKLVGSVDALKLPEVGARLRQGETAWKLEAGGQKISMLSPVDGEVVAVNAAAVADPSVASRDPFGEGWLVKVKGTELPTSARNLLPGNLARQWMEGCVNALRQEVEPSVGLVYQDGGLPVDGIARAVYGDEWADRVREEFLTADSK